MTGQEDIFVFRSALRKWSNYNLRSFSWRDTTDPYEILVAEILLQKTAAEKVEPIYDELIETYPTLDALAEADSDTLGNIIYSLGLQNQRTWALIKIGGELREIGVPADDENLLELPYVGMYAANATLCFAFGEPRAIVDANVVRVYNRFFGTDFDYRDEEAWTFAAEVLPEHDVQEFNLALLDFAAEICTPKTPRCEDCFLTESCDFYQSLS